MIFIALMIHAYVPATRKKKSSIKFSRKIKFFFVLEILVQVFLFVKRKNLKKIEIFDLALNFLFFLIFTKTFFATKISFFSKFIGFIFVFIIKS